MARLSAKLRSFEGKTEAGAAYRALAYWCPGCDDCTVIYIEGGGATWTWDGNVDAPTFSPSIRVSSNGKTLCHHFVRGGNIEFCTDSPHALAGKTVPLPDWPYAEGEYGGV